MYFSKGLLNQTSLFWSPFFMGALRPGFRTEGETTTNHQTWHMFFASRFRRAWDQRLSTQSSTLSALFGAMKHYLANTHTQDRWLKQYGCSCTEHTILFVISPRYLYQRHPNFALACCLWVELVSLLLICCRKGCLLGQVLCLQKVQFLSLRCGLVAGLQCSERVLQPAFSWGADILQTLKSVLLWVENSALYPCRLSFR